MSNERPQGLLKNPEWRIGGRYLNRKTHQPLTLRYIGTLPPSFESVHPSANQTTWLGVEYDDPAQGKGHSGTYEGTQVFTTRQEGAGAFIRLKKGDELEEGKTLVRAVKERYALDEDSRRSNDGSASVALGISGIVVEMPGIQDVQKRLKKLDTLKQIGLEGQYIGRVGGNQAERAELRQRLKGVILLDLSRNLLETWSDVNEIMEVLPSLKTLIINDSRLRGPASECVKNYANLARLKELHLARSFTSWDTLLQIGSIFTGLEELYLSGNPLAQPAAAHLELNGFNSLRSLSLESCGITSWAMLETALSPIRTLETLNISSNPLEINVSSDQKPVLTSLSSLIMLSTPITSLSSMAALSSRLTGLRALKHSLDVSIPLERSDHPPSLVGNASEDRAMLIALYSGLQHMNGTDVRPKERDEAERRFLDLMSKASRPEGITAEWALHDVLARKHGRVVRPSSKMAVPTAQSLRSKLITLHVYPSNSEAISMSILPSTSMALLRRKIAKKVNRNPDDLSLFTVRRTQMEDDCTSDEAQVWANEKVVQAEDGEVGYWFDDGDGVIVE